MGVVAQHNAWVVVVAVVIVVVVWYDVVPVNVLRIGQRWLAVGLNDRQDRRRREGLRDLDLDDLVLRLSIVVLVLRVLGVVFGGGGRGG